MNPGEDSFTLDFKSSFSFYSSDDENERSKDDVDHDAYIELELPSAAADDHDKELELRISFSALVPFPGFFPSSNTCHDSAADDSNPQESTVSCIHQRPISIFPLAWTRLPPPLHHDSSDECRLPLNDVVNGWEIVRTTKVKSGMRKLVVKLRSIVVNGLGSMRASMDSSEAQRRLRLTLIKPFERWLTLCKRLGTNGAGKSNRISKSCPTSVNSSPIHQSGDASNLLHAAIVHCNKSFAQNHDFSF